MCCSEYEVSRCCRRDRSESRKMFLLSVCCGAGRGLPGRLRLGCAERKPEGGCRGCPASSRWPLSTLVRLSVCPFMAISAVPAWDSFPNSILSLFFPVLWTITTRMSLKCHFPTVLLLPEVPPGLPSASYLTSLAFQGKAQYFPAAAHSPVYTLQPCAVPETVGPSPRPHSWLESHLF